MSRTDTAAAPPTAKKVPRTLVLHGETRVDDYFWLRDKANPEVQDYLRAEDAHASAWMKPTEGLQQRLYDEMLGRIQEDDLSVPVRKGGWFYFSRTEKGKQYPILCRKRALDAAEEVVLDLNAMAAGHPFFAIDTYEISDDGNLLLYSTDTTGFREYTLQAMDLRTREDLGIRVEKVSSAAWAADNATVFYVTDDAAKRPYRLWRRTIPAGGEATLVHEETDERFNVGISRTRSLAYLLMSIDSHTQTEVRCLDAEAPWGEFATLVPRAKDLEYDVEHGGGLFYLRINDTGRTYRLVSAPAGDPRRENWVELIPNRPDVMLTGVDVFATHYAVTEKRDGLDRIRIVSLVDGASRDVDFPEPAYAMFPTGNASFDATAYRFQYQSPITPPTVYEQDLRTGEMRILKRQPVLGGYDPARYAVERVWAEAPDGVKVPVSIAYRKDLFRRDGSNPGFLYGYGSYGYPMSPTFSSNRVSLLDRGVVYAIAHVRGGGDLGKPWHDQGRMHRKMNTFTDFIACAEHLVRERYTASDRLGIEGGSAGGLLMGAVVNLRPDLFRAVISKVPFVDVINTMLDETLPLTVGEFEEWGNPKVREDYEVLKAYCPYSNLKPGAYPAMLVKTSTEDRQVMYWEPAKYVARLRTLKTNGTPVLFKVNFAAGHGGASGRYDALKETAFDYAFLLAQVGLSE
ncbi:MAG TPA: S9 family peptidase [Candidatus Polarisedimenticolaceae bacterium]